MFVSILTGLLDTILFKVLGHISTNRLQLWQTLLRSYFNDRPCFDDDGGRNEVLRDEGVPREFLGVELAIVICEKQKEI